MRTFAEMDRLGHEHISFCRDDKAQYQAIIAIHSTVLGPAAGGTRLWSYECEADALTDALRLSRGMTYKNAVAGLPLGGGKSVILKPDSDFDRNAVFEAHGRFVDRFGGRYITAEDVGTSPADMAIMRRETRHVAGLESGGGDPSPHTARGIVRALEAAASWLWADASLNGKTVAIQGCGNVGTHLARALANMGARLVVADVNRDSARRLASELSAAYVEPDEICGVQADVFAPCALGGVLNDESIGALKAAIVVGAANNQLEDDRHGDELLRRGILYVPDYIANAGGVISGSVDLLGWSVDEAREKIEKIHDTTLEVLHMAKANRIAPHRAADRLAEARLQATS